MNAFQYTLVGAIILILFATQWLEWSNNRHEDIKAKAFGLYVETGTKTEAFSLLSRRAVKAAERQRMDTLRERQRETRTFESVCSCPSCTDLNLHFFTLQPYTVLRECRTCGHTWRETR